MLIDIHQNGAKVATQWLRGLKAGYAVATQEKQYKPFKIGVNDGTTKE